MGDPQGEQPRRRSRLARLGRLLTSNWNPPDWNRLSWGDRLAWFVGSGFGSGFFPFAPGTVGSAVAIIWAHLVFLLLPGLGGTLILTAAALAAFALGVWATGRMATAEDPDPGTAALDEVVGMWITFLPAMAVGHWTLVGFGWITLGSGDWWLLLVTLTLLGVEFLSFRLMDIAKPWPCRRLERLPGGWGIMLDDVAAGVWAALLTVAIWLMVVGLWAVTILAEDRF